MTIPPLAYPITFLAALVLGHVFRARDLPHVRFWLLKCIVFFALAGLINALVVPLTMRLFAGLAVFDLAGLPTPVAMLIGLAVVDLINYWVHRVKHTSTFVWRWVHQLHHSAERVDVAGTNYLHPLELAVNIAVTALVGSLLGLSPAATALTGYTFFLLGTFQHSNIATPVWLGYLIQRPEGHTLHHARGIHAFNYGGLALWDLVFGTRRNPPAFTRDAGFWDGASKRLVPMLVGRDVTSEPQGSMNVPPAPRPSAQRSSGARL